MWPGVKRPQEPEKEKKSKERKENIKTNKNIINKKNRLFHTQGRLQIFFVINQKIQVSKVQFYDLSVISKTLTLLSKGAFQRDVLQVTLICLNQEQYDWCVWCEVRGGQLRCEKYWYEIDKPLIKAPKKSGSIGIFREFYV